MGARDHSKLVGLFLTSLALVACEPSYLAGGRSSAVDAGASDADGAMSADAEDGAPEDARATDAPDGPNASDAADAAEHADAADAAEHTDAAEHADAADAADGPVAPSCSITAPIVDATHLALNGVPVAQGGDRSSAPNAPYAVTFVVTTSLVDGATVDLDLDDTATPSVVATVTAQVSNGKAVFTDVALTSGETYEARARCVAGGADGGDGGLTGLSDPRTFPVNATAPELTVSSPHAGDVIPPAGLTNGAFPVCGSTTSPDAVALGAAFGTRAANYCVAVGGASPTCAPAIAIGTDVCVAVPCPGDAPFDVTVTLTDDAGNPTTQTLAAVSCFSTLPSVQIVAPVSDAPSFSNVSRRLLAADAPQTLRDQSASDAGAQTDVVACSNRAGSIGLFAGLAGDATLGALGAAVATRAALPADGCPTGFGFVAVFAGATLRESAEAADTSLVHATELRADLTDLSTAMNSSPVVDLWVDSIDPTLVLTSPTDICGSTNQANSGDDFVIAETVTATAPTVMLDLTNDMSTQTFASTTFTTMTFPFVVFTPGQTVQSGVVRDDAGNVGALVPAPCVVTVGP